MLADTKEKMEITTRLVEAYMASNACPELSCDQNAANEFANFIHTVYCKVSELVK